ncbi:MAG: shikimate kinase [bacterium]|nr:shikimate kinase [bacterium]
MSRSADKSNMFLAGMMGTGKTSTGRLVANALRFVFADTDTLIERRENMTVNEIFARHGEQYFRDREYDLLTELCEQDRQVIATGGGMLAVPENLTLAKKTDWWCF